MALGFEINLFNGVNMNELYRISNIDKLNNKITVENGAINSFSAYTTYVRINVYSIRNFEIGPAWEYIVGESKIGGSYIPANIPVTVSYTNKSTDTDKKFVGYLEYLY